MMQNKLVQPDTGRQYEERKNLARNQAGKVEGNERLENFVCQPA
jgi:hypothetical protein